MMEASKETQNSPSKHQSLYFPDGDIVLSVGASSSNCVLYRLDKVLLARHSPVFAGLFCLPEPSTSVNERYEGAPVVHLPDDDPAAMDDLFSFLYKPACVAFGILAAAIAKNFDRSRSLVFKKRDSDTPMRGMKLLKVADKYQIDGPRQLIVQQIENDWPKSLAELLQQQAELERICDIDLFTTFKDVILDNQFPEPASAIRIAIDFNIPTILPAAFYVLSQIEPENDYARYRGGPWDAWTGMDDDIAEGNNKVSITALPSRRMRTARWPVLDKDEQYNAWLGRNALQRAIRDVERSFTRAPCPYEYDHCTHKRARLFKEHAESEEDMKDPFKRLVNMIYNVSAADGLCEECGSFFSEEAHPVMQNIWDQIPRMFSIDQLLGESATQATTRAPSL